MNIILDLRYALRRLAANPGYTCAAVFTLALGIGANTAIYSVIDGVLLHPIPFPDPDRLVVMYQKSGRDEKNSVSFPNLLDWQKLSQSFEGIAGQRTASYTLSGKGEPEQVTGEMVSSNFLSVLGIQPVRGRMFSADEDKRGAQPVALLGEDFWRRRFSGDPKAIGQSLMLDGRAYAVIGVVPASVRMERLGNSFSNDVFVPLGQYDDPLFLTRGVGDVLEGLGRLKAGVPMEQAGAEMRGIMADLAKAYPEEDGNVEANLVAFPRDAIGDLEPTLLALGAAVGFVLLIACTNIANLALARSASRSQEFAVRMALGAQRGRLMRQLLTESAVLSIGAGAVGVLIAAWCTDAALSVLPSALPAVAQVGLNVRVLLFSFAAAVLTSVLCGFAPAWKAADSGLNQSLRQGGRGSVRGRYRIQHALIVSEVALTLVLLVGAGLMTRSLEKLWTVSPGFQPEGVLTFYTGLSKTHMANPEAIRAAFGEIDARLATVPGVEAASVDIGGLPFRGNTTLGFSIEGDPKTKERRESREAHFYAVGPDHFKAMGIPLLRGRAFTKQDTMDHPLVAIVDEELARSVFPGQDALGKLITVYLYGKPAEIIGIAGHVKHSGLDLDATATARGQMYFSYRQLPDSILPLAAQIVTGIVRTNAPAAGMLGAIRKELAAYDNGRAVHGEQLMTDAIAGSLAKRRFSLMVLGAFAGTALILAMIGIYGVVSYFVSQRTNEIGVRLALGAQPRDIFVDVLGEGGRLGAIGVAIGLAGAAALTRLMASMLFGISATDRLTFAAAGILLFALTMLACYIPARRAVRIDPMAALRSE